MLTLGIQSGNSHGDCGTELTRFTPALLSPRFRQSVGTLVLRGEGGILSLYQDRLVAIELDQQVDWEERYSIKERTYSQRSRQSW